MKDVTVVFDLDGTMIDTAGDLTRALNHLLAKMGLPSADRAIIGETTGQGAKAMIQRAMLALNQQVPETHFDPLVEDFIAYYREHIAVESKPFPGFVEALQWLRTEGANFAVCTNKREELARKLLSELKLDDYFAAIVGGDTLPVRKPHPDHLLGAIMAAGGKPNRSVMVGDSRTDIQAARGAGVPVVTVSWGYWDEPLEKLKPDAVIHHFSELRAALEALFPDCVKRDVGGH